jgi:hypothetical protein
MNPSRALAVFLFGAMLQGCGGGEDDGPPPPVPLPAPPPVVSLASTNYQDAVRVPMRSAQSAYTHATLGISIVDNLLNRPLSFFPAPCPQGGTVTYELTDQNADSSLDPGDTVHIRWNACRINGSSSTGLVRVQLTSGVQIPGGREYQITVFVVNLELTSDLVVAPPLTVNCIVPLLYTRTATTDHVVIQGATFSSGHLAGDTGTAEVFLDYLQDHATQTYRYEIAGNASSGALGGRVDFTTPQPFTGVIGEFPSAGRLSVTGTGSSARLSEEGTAANDNAAVFAAVDSNGDGVIDASNAAMNWASVVPVRMFAAFGTQVGIGVPAP